MVMMSKEMIRTVRQETREMVSKKTVGIVRKVWNTCRDNLLLLNLKFFAPDRVQVGGASI